MIMTRAIYKVGWLIGMLMIGVASATPIIERVGPPIERPSMISELAETALLTAVTRVGSRLVAVGDRGIVLISSDEGLSWVQRPTPVSVLLTGVHFIDEDRGWAVGHGGVVLSTSNGGEQWDKVLDGTQLAALLLERAMARAAALPADESEESVQAARDIQDAKLLVEDGPDKPFLSVYADEDIGLLVTGAFGLLLHSDNGGVTWESWQNRVPNYMGNHLYAVLRSGDALYLVGEQGSVFRSDDLGQSFEALSAPYEGSFFGAIAVGEQGVMAFGLRGNAFVYQDASGWQRIELPTNATVNNGVRLNDGSIILVTQAGEALHYSVDAQTFDRLKVPASAPLVGIDQINDDTVVLAGARGITLVPLNILETRS